MLVHLLIDYDNARPYRAERSVIDVQANAHAIIDACLGLLCDLGHYRGELHVRLYGGWLTERGEYTPRGEWLLGALPSLRGRRRTWRVLPEIALSIMHYPGTPLVGSYRAARTGSEQKMVDTMLAVDMLFVATSPGGKLVLVTDDDDLVPPTLAARTLTTDLLIVARRRAAGAGLNDAVCTQCGVAYVRLPEGP